MLPNLTDQNDSRRDISTTYQYRVLAEATGPQVKLLLELFLIVLVGVVTFVFAVIVNFHPFRFLLEVTQSYEAWKLDELIWTGLVVCFGAMIFALRRWLELRKEIERRRIAEEKLFHVNEDLEKIVDERTCELEDGRQKLELALEAGNLGMWDWNIQSGRMACSRFGIEMLGYSKGEIEPLYEAWSRLAHPEDRDLIHTAFDAYMRGETSLYETEHRLQHKSGHWIWNLARGKIIERLPDGTPIRMVGTNMDVTERRKAELALKESEEKYRLVVENAKEAIFLFQNQKIRLANPAGIEILGYSKKELFSGSFLDPIAPEDREMVRQYHFRRLEGKEVPNRYSFRVRSARGDMRWIEIDPVKVTWEGEPAILTFMIDITDRKAAEDKLRESEERFREFASLLPQFVYELNTAGKLTFVNQAAVNATGVTPEDLQNGVMVTDLFVPEDRDKVAESVQRLLSGERLEGREYTLMAKEGMSLPLMTYSSPIEKDNKIVGVRGIAVDVSPLKDAESRIRASLEEKDLLLREIHHRVKNNLAIVNSLLRLQSRYAKDHRHRQMFLEAQQRIKSMAFAHEMLYNSDRLADIDAKEYVDKLVDHLVASVGLSRQRINFQKHIHDMSLGLDTAIPLGFILTELVTNALKHAFPDGSKGLIEVRLTEAEDNTLELVVKDSGVGLPATIDLIKPRSFGLRLVKIFTEQIGGQINIASTPGTELRLSFPHK